MSHLKRLATPQSLPSSQLASRTRSKLSTRAPTGRALVPDVQAIETRFLSLLAEASRAHSHVPLRRQLCARDHATYAHRPIREVQHQTKRSITTSSAQRSLAQVTTADDPPIPSEYSHWNAANRIPRTEFYSFFGKRRRVLSRKEDLQEKKGDAEDVARPEQMAAATWDLPGGDIMPIAWTPVAKERDAVSRPSEKLSDTGTCSTETTQTGPYGLPVTPIAHFLAAADSADQYVAPSQISQDLAHAERIKHYPLASRLSPLQDPPVKTRRAHEVLPIASTATRNKMLRLEFRLRASPGTCNKTAMWNDFEALDKPQVRRLSVQQIRRFFMHLGVAEHHAEPDTRRKILSLYQQCIDEDIWLDRETFTMVMTYAGRGDRRPSLDHVKQAIQVWSQMEERGIMADNAVFNTLYHIAVMARRFSLAQVLFSELKARKLAINRYMRCSMITCAGMCRDSDAVRSAFSDLVNAGEVVDTAVMNCVLRALIEADDGEGAESTFDNMKSLYSEQFLTRPITAWQDRRRLARRANEAKYRIQKEQQQHQNSFFGGLYADKDRLQELQLLSPVAPDAATYRIMVGYHALKSGDFDRVRELIEEMRALSFHVHGSVYGKVFRGFALHRDLEARRAWSQVALNQFWKEFLSASRSCVSGCKTEDVDQRASEFMKAAQTPEQQQYAEQSGKPSRDELSRDIYFSLALAKTILTAFRSCIGVVRMQQVATKIRAEWTDMTPVEARELTSHERACAETWGHLGVQQPHYTPVRLSPHTL